MRLEPSEMKRALALLHPQGDVFEVRLSCQDGKYSFWQSGYFDDVEKAVAAVRAEAKIVTAAYAGLNPVKADILARASNRFRRGRDAVHANDVDICRRRLLLLDFDPHRPKGVSSTLDELARAWERAVLTVGPDLLSDFGWPAPATIMSGNGMHLAFAVDLEPEDDIVGRVLQALAGKYSDDLVDLDVTVANASRIAKIPGTMAKKGDSTKLRPHRMARLWDPVPSSTSTSLETIPREALERLVDTLERVGPQTKGKARSSSCSRNTTGASQSWNDLPAADADFSRIQDGCPFIAHFSEHPDEATEPQWFSVLSVVGKCKGREQLIHEVSKGHVGYDAVDTERKALRLATNYQPLNCSTIRAERGGASFCDTCPSAELVTNPVVLGRRRTRKEARTVVDEALAGDEVKRLFEPDVLRALATLKSASAKEWDRVCVELKRLRLKTKVEEAIKRLRDKVSSSAVNVGAAPRPCTALAAKGFTPSLPRGYMEAGGGIAKVTGSDIDGNATLVPVAPSPIAVVGRGLHVQDGDEQLSLRWVRAGKTEEQEVPRQDVMNKNAIHRLSAFGAPVTSETAAGLVTYLAAQELADINRMPSKLVSRQNGWVDSSAGPVFLSGSRSLGPLPILYRDPEAGADITRGLRAAGTLEGWQEAVAPLEQHPVVRFTMASVFAAPLLHIVGIKNPAVELASPTSRGKTTCAQIAGSAMGDPRLVVRSWDTTSVGAERSAAALCDHATILDETSRADERTIKRVLYQFESGVGRTRGSKQGLQRLDTWRGMLVSTGESPIWEMQSFGGLRARVLVVMRQPFPRLSPSFFHDLDLRLSQHYGTALPAFVQFLIDQHDKWPDIRARHLAESSRYAAAAKGSVGQRLAKTAGLLWVAAKLATKAGVLPWAFADPVPDDLWAEILGAAEGVDVYTAHFDHIASLVARHRQNFEGQESACVPQRENFGRWHKDDTEVFIWPDVLDRWLLDRPANPKEVLRVWRERGLLVTDPGRLKKQVRVQGSDSPQKLYAVPVHAIENGYDDAPDDDLPM